MPPTGDATPEVASDRTFVTELATALGTLGDEDLDGVIRRRPPVMVNLTDNDWEHLRVLRECGDFAAEFQSGFDNGRSFFLAPDALGGRRPRVVEWTGGRRAPGDEVTPADLRIDHVYLVSCKYRSKILHNPSPARLVDGLLSHDPVDDSRDWFERMAPKEYEALYVHCVQSTDGAFPMFAAGLDATARKDLSTALREGWPDGSLALYEQLCTTVSDATAQRWRDKIGDQYGEQMVWRLLRIGAAPYFILGTDTHDAIRLRVDSPWDWRHTYRLNRLDIAAQPGGQSRVGWAAHCEELRSGREVIAEGHVEIRWSHGRFAQRPEAKVYLDSPTSQVPGYHRL